ncbi:MAG: polyprenyl synthetase family protein [Deltaproteobacteria bacterium]|nr:polyprenyl synthetase family protein [Deltaproteobacteria bacterium]
MTTTTAERSTGSNSFDLHSYLKYNKDKVDNALKEVMKTYDCPSPLQEAMLYSLAAGGKRLRPILVIAASNLNGSPACDPMPAACALEFVHTYSLIHDDLPAMDDDDFRRGKPTNHKVFGEALAILAGDALLTEAFTIISKAYGSEFPAIAAGVTAELASSAGAEGMVGGQVLDTIATGNTPDIVEMERLHRMKTGALIKSALLIGGIVGGVGPEKLDALERYGLELGLAFQITDDLLDVTGDLVSLGKTPGSDERMNKPTYPKLLGIEAARSLAAEVRDRAIDSLKSFGNNAEPLCAIAHYVVERSF